MKTPSLKQFVFDEQGIAMTEGVIVIPIFIIIWLGLLVFHGLYKSRLEVQVTSAANALSTSYSGCSNDDTSNHYENSNKAQNNPDDDNWLTKLAGNQPFGFSHISGKSEIVVEKIPKTLGGLNFTLKAKQKYICNMKPKKGLLDMIISIARDAMDKNK